METSSKKIGLLQEQIELRDTKITKLSKSLHEMKETNISLNKSLQKQELSISRLNSLESSLREKIQSMNAMQISFETRERATDDRIFNLEKELNEMKEEVKRLEYREQVHIKEIGKKSNSWV